jgi:stage V sporulation protein G
MTTTNKAVEHTFDCLAVTDVKIFPFKEDNVGVTKAMANIVLNDQLIIRGLRVKDGVNGLFVSFPLDPFFRGEEFRNVCFPLTRQLREHIENVVIEKYQNIMEA